jgi:hypothetical protein
MSQEKSRNGFVRFGFLERLAATYSRRIYKTTTIGKTVFDGRVRNGIGSDHSFMATKKECRMQGSERRIKRSEGQTAKCQKSVPEAGVL